MSDNSYSLGTFWIGMRPLNKLWMSHIWIFEVIKIINKTDKTKFCLNSKYTQNDPNYKIAFPLQQWVSECVNDVCVCVCVWEREREREGEHKHLVQKLRTVHQY